MRTGLMATAVLASSFATVATVATASLVSVRWTGAANGSWADPSSWTPRIVPDNGADAYDVTIDALPRQDSVVGLTSSATVQSISISRGDALVISNGATLMLAGSADSIDGILRIDTAAPTTVLRFTQDATVSGGGEIRLGPSSANRLETAPGKRLTIDASLSLRAQGGAIAGLLTNNGLIEAIGPNPLIWSVAAGTNINSGALRSSAGTLRINGGAISNAGLMEAVSNGALEFDGVGSVTGGSLDSSAGLGAAIVSNAQRTFTDVAIAGPLTLKSNSKMTIAGAIALEGTISVESGSSTTLFVTAPLVTIGNSSGATAAIVLKQIGSNQANIERLSSTSTALSMDANTTIRGSGAINYLRLLNHGTLLADSTIDLIVRPAPLSTNDGLLSANAGDLTIADGDWDNANGVMEAINGGVLRLGTAVRHGLIRSISGTVLTDSGLPSAPTAIFEDLTLEGTITVAAKVGLKGSITLDGSLTVPSGTLAELLSATVTLSGGGNVALQGGKFGNNQAPYFPFVLHPGVLLRGHGVFGGFDALTIEPSALVLADDAGQILEVSSAGTPTPTSTNDGVLRGNPGTLRVTSGNFDNADGVLEASGGGTLRISNNTKINGGVIANRGGSVLVGDLGSDGASTASWLDGVVLEGEIAVVSDGALRVSHQLVVNGSLTIAAPNQQPFTKVLVTDPTSIEGSGELVLEAADGALIRADALAAALTFGPGFTVRGTGRIGADSLAITNHGAIIAEGGAITIDPSSTGLASDGLLRAATGDLILLAGPMTSSGTIRVDAGQSIFRLGTMTQTGGSIEGDGTLWINGNGQLVVVGGAVRASSIVGNLVNSAGVTNPGGDEIRTLAVTNFSQGANGTLELDIAGPSPEAHDRVAVTGNAALSGTLRLRFDASNAAHAGDTLVLLTSPHVTGSLTAIDSCVPVQILTSTDSVIAVVTADPPRFGDIDGDGSVGASDLGALLGAWGGCVDHCCTADLNHDQLVDSADLAMLLGAWE